MLILELRYVLRGEGEPTGVQSTVMCGNVAAGAIPSSTDETLSVCADLLRRGLGPFLGS